LMIRLNNRGVEAVCKAGGGWTSGRAAHSYTVVYGHPIQVTRLGT
jgi:hypothetical protein